MRHEDTTLYGERRAYRGISYYIQSGTLETNHLHQYGYKYTVARIHFRYFVQSQDLVRKFTRAEKHNTYT